jgi:hypothetical protein
LPDFETPGRNATFSDLSQAPTAGAFVGNATIHQNQHRAAAIAHGKCFGARFCKRVYPIKDAI